MLRSLFQRLGIAVLLVLLMTMALSLRMPLHTVFAQGGLSIPSTGTVTQPFLGNNSLEKWYSSYYDQNNVLQTRPKKGAHSGVDISNGNVDCSTANPVYAAASGTVIWAGFDPSGKGFGWSVVVNNGFGIGGNGYYTYTLYGHMGTVGTSQKKSTSCVQVQVGQQVNPAGSSNPTILGYQGSSGLKKPATHVHFTIFAGTQNVTQLSSPYVPNAYPASPDFYTCLALTQGDASPTSSVTAGQSGCTTPPTYFDDFSSYTPGQPPTGYLLRGASGVVPTVQEVGGTGPAYRLLSFPYVGGQYWDSWALKDGLTLQAPYVVTVKLNFQTSGDRGGLTIAWNDTNWDRIDIQPNIYWQDVEFRITYTGPNPSSPVVTGAALTPGGLPMQVGTDYWLQVAATSNGPGQGQVIVSWSTDGTNFTPIVTATGLADVSGLAGMGTAGPNLPNTFFDDFQIA